MRIRLQTCKIILATSLIWFLIDIVVLLYYTDGANRADGKGGPSADSLVHHGDMNRREANVNSHNSNDVSDPHHQLGASDTDEKVYSLLLKSVPLKGWR